MRRGWEFKGIIVALSVSKLPDRLLLRFRDPHIKHSSLETGFFGWFNAVIATANRVLGPNYFITHDRSVRSTPVSNSVTQPDSSVEVIIQSKIPNPKSMDSPAIAVIFKRSSLDGEQVDGINWSAAGHILKHFSNFLSPQRQLV